MLADWDYFDKIYCISLDERPDRQKEARRAFAGVGLSEAVEFVIVKKHPRNCEQGIYESHLQCMKKGLDAGAENILIFEDDIAFDRFTAEALGRAVGFLSSGWTWNMFFFGCMVKGSKRTAHPSIVNIRYRSLTHAYAIHHRFARKLLGRPWREVPYDDFLRDLEDKQMFALYPSIAFQSDSRSDNERYLPLDRVRRLFGGLQNLQKKNEFYHRHKALIIGAHVLALLLIILAIR